jgi:hypothetical protein
MLTIAHETHLHRQQKPLLVPREQVAIHIASPEETTLSAWQCAVLAYASAKCGLAFTSIEQTDWWLRNNPRDAQHLTVKALRELLAVKPPRGVKIIPPAPPTPAA